MQYTKEQAWEISLLALCAWREARSDGFAGMLAVCWSVRNRVNHPGWWGKDWRSVIQKSFQYSSFNLGDPNAKLLPGATDTTWPDALAAAEIAYAGQGDDPTLGATHYHAVTMMPFPTWVYDKETVFLAQAGQHLFYKAR